MAKNKKKPAAKKAPAKAPTAKKSPAKAKAPAKPAMKAAPKKAAPAPKAVVAKPAALPAKAAVPPTKAATSAAILATRGKPGSLLSAPIPPKSRLTAREPAAADDLKMKIGALATAINQIKAVKRSIQRSFWDVGNILVDIRDRKLYVAKGYGSFEAFLEREIELGKTTSLRIARAVQIFQKEPAVAAGMERVVAAVAAFDGEAEPAAMASAGQQRSATSTSVGITRSPIPFHKQ